jgi:hypothetical protein
MNLHQWEVWKAKPVGFERPHWFVLISNQERLDSQRAPALNGLCCFTLRGTPARSEVVLNSADGFAAPTICQCDLIYVLDKSGLHDPHGFISWERQQTIKAKLKEVYRL